MKKYILWAVTVIMAATFTLYSFPASAEQSDYAWVLVDVIDYDSAEAWAVANESPVYQNDYSCSQGSMSVKRTYIGKTDDWYNPPKKYGEGVRVTANFSSPPEKLSPGEEVNISLNISASDNTLSFFTFGGFAGADFDKPEIEPGARHRDATLFADKDGETSFNVDATNNYGTINETLTATVPRGREEGEQIALRQKFYMGLSMGTYYIYEWQGTDYQPVKKPQQNMPTMNNETVPFQGDPGMKRSGVGISDLHGEVLVVLYDDDGNYIDSYTPNVGEELAVNAVIETRDNSGVQLSLRDMTTFVIKSNSKVRVGDQTEDENKLSILAGHVWGNVKQMLKDGSMDLEMSQAAAGIKGTTFILEEDGKTSTVKVFEGAVEVTPLNEGKPVMVKGGNTVSATQTGLSDVQSFDMDSELAKWDENVREITIEAMEENKSGLSLGTVIIVLAAALLVIGGLLKSTRGLKRKQAAMVNAQYGCAPASQPEHSQYGVSNTVTPSRPSSKQKFCKNCGKQLSANSKFCSGCGQSI